MTGNRRVTHSISESESNLWEQAVAAAVRAPSLFNSQPWRWRISGGRLELRADRDRQLKVVDPEGRLLTLSCGIALHHACVALAAAGFHTEQRRLPDSSDADLLAEIHLVEPVAPTPEQFRHYQSILIRHTDRRPFTQIPVPESTIDLLRDAVAHHQTYLHMIRPEQVVELIVAAENAAQAEMTDPAYRDELTAWTHRPSDSSDGVPDTTAVRRVPRRVPVRDFAVGGTPRLEPGTGDDKGTAYAVLFTNDDNPNGWLRAGEGLSALLLTAVEHNVAVAPMSDVIEVPAARQVLRRMLAGIGAPLLVLRIGIAEPTSGVPPTPRRDIAEVIDSD